MPSELVLASLLLTAAPAEVQERILAVVDEHPLLLSEVRAVEAVSGRPREEALELLIDERLMYEQAARLPQAAVSTEEESRALESLLERKPSLRARASEPDLRRMARRQAAILKLVEFRFRPQVRVDEEEVRRAWDERYGGRGDAPPVEETAAALREELARRALDERVEAWVKELRAAAEIRYNR